MSMVEQPEPRPGSEGNVLGRRIAATLIDTLIVFFLYYVTLLAIAGVLFEGLGTTLTFFNYLFWFVISVLGFTPLLSLHGGSWVWFLTATLTWAAYATILEAIWGQTIGKAVTGITVIRTDGSSCGVVPAMIRNLLRLVDGLLYYFVGLMILSLSSDKQRLGDRLAGTLVVGVRDRVD